MLSKQEMKKIARVIAQNEKVLENRNSTRDEKASAMQRIEDLTTRFTSLEEMMYVDDLVQDLLK